MISILRGNTSSLALPARNLLPLYTKTKWNSVAPLANELEIYDYLLHEGVDVDIANATLQFVYRAHCVKTTSPTKPEVHNVLHCL